MKDISFELTARMVYFKETFLELTLFLLCSSKRSSTNNFPTAIERAALVDDAHSRHLALRC